MAMKLMRLLGTTIIVLLMMAALGVFLAPRLGWRVDAVYSGSMEPEFRAGDVVVTQPLQTTKIKEGDVITCPKETEHWHTASKESDVTYLAIYGGAQPTTWTEVLTQAYYDSIAEKLAGD